MIALVAALVVTYGFWASSFDISQVKEIPQRSMVYDKNGALYSRLQGENRIVVKRSEVSGNFVDALLAREDTRFRAHHGIDPIGIVRAVVRNLGAGSARQGASTLTQQLARNTFPLGGKNVHRKILEAFVAMRIEQHYTKEEIMEHYMNRIYFGNGVYGVETASLAYFGKSAKNLSLGEAAMLAGIIRGPTRFSPRKHFQAALAQRDQVLERMVKLEKITKPEADAARQAKPVVVRKPRLMLQENYAMEALREELDAKLNDDQEASGGMKIYTTIDPALQRAAEQALDANLRKIEQRPGYAHPKRDAFASLSEDEKTRTPYLQGAAMVIDNRNGSIRAVVGGRDFTESPFNRAREARRQVGSTFKPFEYAVAFQRGLLPGTLVSDGPITRGEIPGAENWQPANSDGTFHDALSAEQGLIQSRNTMSVRIGNQAGLNNVVNFARAAGFAEVPAQPAIYLGGFEASLAEVTAAYTVFPNLGTRRDVYMIERIDDASGETIYRAKHEAQQVADPAVCWVTTKALERVMAKGGTAASVKSEGFTKPCAGKTGTTNDYVDAWFVGYTTSLTCGVWVGLDQPKTIISKGYGATLALPIWADVMGAAGKGDAYPAKPFTGIEPMRCMLCSVSGGLATGGCESFGTAYQDELPPSLVPRSACNLHRGAILTERRREGPRRSIGQGLLRSFRKFFGGD